jgi:hypothetical protein
MMLLFIRWFAEMGDKRIQSYNRHHQLLSPISLISFIPFLHPRDKGLGECGCRSFPYFTCDVRSRESALRADRRF